ncbi:unnamed protein product, partial [Sphagnum jensenii]
ALASIGAPVDDEDLVAVTLNGLGKDYSQFPHGGGRGNFGGRGSRGGRGGSHRGQQPNCDSNCYYCGKPGHMAKNYYQREHDARNGKLQQGNYASTSNQGDEQL